MTVTLGDRVDATVTTVKAESRRLMLERVRTEPGTFATRAFVVNVRTPRITGGGQVRLKDRERGVLHWDDKLTLEFNDARPCVCALEIEPADDVTTVFLVGDSTVTDQPHEPWNSWGQMLPCFFGPGVAVANHAESGETLRSSLGARRLDKVLGQMVPGITVHPVRAQRPERARAGRRGVHDLPGGPEALRPGGARTWRPPRARDVDASPDLRRRRPHRREPGRLPRGGPPGGPRGGRRPDRPERHEQALYEALGPGGSAKAFVDGTHHSNYGSYELARCVSRGSGGASWAWRRTSRRT